MAKLTTANFQWQDIWQVRCGVSVSAAINLLKASPKPVVEVKLADWSLKPLGDECAVWHKTGMPNTFRMNNLPNDRDSRFPVLIGQANSMQFLIDGAHRIARALVKGRKTARAVIFYEEETRQCVRFGQMKHFERCVGRAI
jgi:hypothetical protein